MEKLKKQHDQLTKLINYFLITLEMNFNDWKTFRWNPRMDERAVAQSLKLIRAFCRDRNRVHEALMTPASSQSRGPDVKLDLPSLKPIATIENVNVLNSSSSVSSSNIFFEGEQIIHVGMLSASNFQSIEHLVDTLYNRYANDIICVFYRPGPDEYVIYEVNTDAMGRTTFRCVKLKDDETWMCV